MKRLDDNISFHQLNIFFLQNNYSLFTSHRWNPSVSHIRKFSLIACCNLYYYYYKMCENFQAMRTHPVNQKNINLCAKVGRNFTITMVKLSFQKALDWFCFDDEYPNGDGLLNEDAFNSYLNSLNIYFFVGLLAKIFFEVQFSEKFLVSQK
ncbi:hypothetical protein BpHYR1_038451 [Brachionus plicatilis]|uniref:Uncharacterized protein n=1 Tax=Brachionus plicatilis TaxID=10195 RepID=A0A3M7Q6N2_BRAPC|nr:hypothetical protein BpHYR1_038451 [Brachionus plicatilis]